MAIFGHVSRRWVEDRWARHMRLSRQKPAVDHLSVPPRSKDDAADELLHLAGISNRAGLHNMARRLTVLSEWLRGEQADPETKGEIG